MLFRSRVRGAVLPIGAVALMTCLPVGAAESATEEAEAGGIEETDIAVAPSEAEEEDEDVETMVVTGSFIRRETFDLPSPTDTIDEVDLEFSGTPDIGDVIFDQTYQVGVNANAAPFEFGGGDDQSEQLGAEVFANLRGLGTRATMTMMDGHRVPANVQGYSFWTRRAGTDVTNLYPSIAIGRVETILDGASALYGSEAVSGVVNFIPRKNFDGLEVRYQVQQQVEDGTPSKSIGLLAGAQGERTSAIFAMEIRDEERWEATARPDFIVSSTGWTGQMLPTYGESDRGFPGNWRVPHRAATGELEVPPLAGWKNFPDPADARSGFVASSGPWFLYPSTPGQNNYFIPAPPDQQSVRDGRRVYGATFDYGAAMNDTTDELRTVNRYDPGCGFHFGAGHDDLGDPATADEFGLGYNDATKKGNFLNGYTTGNIRGIETRSFGDERGSHGAGESCRRVTSDWQDLRARSDRQSGMGYFEHEFNDYFTVRGELVASSMEYDTRDRAFQIDEWNQGNTFFGPDVAVAIGSNPGNPFRAFADGSNACDYMPSLAGCDEFSPLGLRLDLANQEVDPIPDAFHADTFLSYIDANGDSRYNYMEEAGELLVYAQDINGDGLPDRDLNGDGMVDDAELANVAAQKDPAYRVLLLSMEADTDGDGVPDRLAYGNGFGVVGADFNRDGMADVYVANDMTVNQLWINRGGLRFVDSASAMGAAVDGYGTAKAGMGVAAADIDDDGDSDLLVVNLEGQSDSLFRNQGEWFDDATAQYGLAVSSRRHTRFGVAWADFDNDGVLDLYQANGRVSAEEGGEGDVFAEPNMLYRGTLGGPFEVVPGGGVAHPLVHTSRGLSVGDVDDDGGLDLLIVNRDARAYLLMNRVPKRGNWVRFRVVDGHGRDSHLAEVSGIVGTARKHRDVQTASSYLSANSSRVHFGLGDREVIADVVVRWPDGRSEAFGDFRGGETVALRRGTGEPRTR